MRPIRGERASGTYHPPIGLEREVSGLPYWRETRDGLPTVLSEWTLEDEERAAIAAGGTVVLGIVGEPIPPVSLEVWQSKDPGDVVLVSRRTIAAELAEARERGRGEVSGFASLVAGLLGGLAIGIVVAAILLR